MGIIHQLKITSAAPRKEDTSREGRFMRRMAEALSLQIDIARADADGLAFNRLHQRWVKGADGSKELRNVPIAIRRWWWSDDKGVTYVTLKYGARPIELAPDKNAIEIGPISESPGQLAMLRDAVLAGELDGQARKADKPRAVPKTGKSSAPARANARA